MTTNVTVQYGGDPLLERSRQQQQAARQAKLHADRVKAQAQQDKAKREREGTLPSQQRYGVPQPPALRKDEPAAWRPAANGLPYFYVNYGESRFISGDGKKQVIPTPEVNAPDPGTPSYSLPQLSIAATSSAQYPGDTDSFGWANAGAVAGTRVLRVGSIETVEYEHLSRRAIDYYSGTQVALPLGNGAALVASLTRKGYASVIVRYYYHKEIEYDAYNDKVRDTLISETLTCSVENAWAFYDSYSAVEVGYRSAQQRLLPSTLLALLQEKTPTPSSFYRPFTITRVPCVGAICDGFLGPNGNNTDINGNLLQTTVFSPLPETAAYPMSPYLPAYGLVREQVSGYINDSFSCTPLSWFKLNNPALQQGSLPDTHESLYSLHVDGDDGVTAGSLFSSGSMLRIGDNLFTTSGRSAGRAQTYAGPALTGSIQDVALPVNYDPTQWRAGVYILRSIGAVNPPFTVGDSYTDAKRCFINDWGQPQFCKQQAGLYGL